MFDTHSAPSAGTTTTMIQCIRSIREVKGFPAFLELMGLAAPAPSQFTSFLRTTITDSARVGYSGVPLSQAQLYLVRKSRNQGVQKVDGLQITWEDERWWNFD
jgi:hypothetical protein